MLNKKTIIIITSAVIIFILSAVAVFLWKTRSEDLKNNKTSGNVGSENINLPASDNTIADNLNKLKDIHPEYSQTQLKFYSDAAAKWDTMSCLSEPDANECVSAVAYLKSDRSICHDLEKLGKNETLFNQCTNTILKKIAQAEISRCNTLSDDDYYYCLTLLFNVKNQQENCPIFLEAETRLICQDYFNFQAAFSSYDRALCKNIKTEKLNEYCLKVIIDKKQDTDGDGINDGEEI